MWSQNIPGMQAASQILACMTDASAGQMLIGDNAFTEFKGAFTEQYVLPVSYTHLDASKYLLK